MDKKSDDSFFLRMLAMGQYEFIDATFVAADTDTTLIYSILKPEDPNSVRWIDVTPTGNTIYRAQDPNKVRWENGYIILRATDACTTRLLLFLGRE
jgi:hypothetical protein